MSAPKREHLATLICKIIDELRVLAILASESFSQLEHGSVDGHCAVALEHRLNGRQSMLANRHVGGQIVLGALRKLGLAAGGVGLDDSPERALGNVTTT